VRREKSKAVEMNRTALGLVVTAFAACMLAASASAQVGSGVPDCDKTYRDMWLGGLPVAAKDLPGGDLAELHRYALRAYDGCTSGDERTLAQQLLQKLESVRGSDAAQHLRDLVKSLPAK
jgi:hypothetical protein